MRSRFVHHGTEKGNRRKMDAAHTPSVRTAILRTLGLTLIGAGTAIALCMPSCTLDGVRYPDSAPPVTFLAIQAESLRVSNYRTILHWWGTDADGRVIGYAYRWDGPWQPEPEDSLWWEDSTWVFTESTCDTFDVAICGSYAERTFQIRAIDNDLLCDPEPLSQQFRLENFIPLVSWTDTTRHPTLDQPSLPAISFAWNPEDYDGRETVKFARLWLDIEEGEDSLASSLTVVEDTVGAFFPEHFQGRYGERTVYLQLVDAASTPSEIISWTWNVVEPAGEYLLIDNAWPSGRSAVDKQDRFWRERMEALVPGNYHVYDVEGEGVFRSRQEVLPLFQLFKGVLWYGIKHYADSRPVDRAMKKGLELAEGSLVEYASSGGALLITGHNVMGTEGGLSSTFLEEGFGIEKIYSYREDEQWITDLDLPKGAYVHCGPLMGGTDSLRVRTRVPNSDYFRTSGDLEPLLWLEPATLDTTKLPEHATEPFYLAALAERGAGRLVLCSTLLTDFRSSSNPEDAIENLLRYLFDLP